MCVVSGRLLHTGGSHGREREGKPVDWDTTIPGVTETEWEPGKPRMGEG